jgi:hypothetical protein
MKRRAEKDHYWKIKSLSTICEEVITTDSKIFNVIVDTQKDELKEPIKQAQEIYKIIERKANNRPFGAVKTQFLVFQKGPKQYEEE